MNAVITNKYRENIKTIGIEITGLLEGEYTADDIIQAFNNYYYEKLVLDITSIKDYRNAEFLIVNLKKVFTFLDSERSVLLLENIPELNNSMFLSKLVNIKLFNFTFDINEIKTLLLTPKTYEQVSNYTNVQETPKINKNIQVIGIKNVTSHAGATTLSYMMYQELSKNYKTKCIEVGKDDYKYFMNEDFRSVAKEHFVDEFLKEENYEIALVDLNDYENEMIVKDILYLIEPSVLKLNKLLDKDKTALIKLENRKIILNRTNISIEKTKQFEEETKIKVFDMIRNLNERDEVNPQIMNLLLKLGFKKTNGGVVSADDTEKKKSIFDSFK